MWSSLTLVTGLKPLLCMQIRMFTQFVNVLDVTVLPPHEPSAIERQNPEVFAATVRAEYAVASGYCLAEQGQREFVALCKVPRVHLHPVIYHCHAIFSVSAAARDGRCFTGFVRRLLRGL